MDFKLKGINIPELINMDKIPNSPAIISTNLEPEQIIALAKDNRIRHIIQKENLFFEEELNVSSIMLQQPTTFINSPLAIIFGKTVDENTTDRNFCPKAFSVTHIRDKNIILRTLEKHCTFLKLRSSLQDEVLLAADELITNAIYNAPFVDGEKVLSGPSRKFQEVDIDPLKKPTFFWQADEQRIVIGCKDLYGALRVPHMLGRIQKCYTDGPSQHINYGSGGAGIGTFLVFKSCASFYVAVERGTFSLVCCSFPYKISGAKREALPKNIHWIEKEA